MKTRPAVAGFDAFSGLGYTDGKWRVQALHTRDATSLRIPSLAGESSNMMDHGFRNHVARHFSWGFPRGLLVAVMFSGWVAVAAVAGGQPPSSATDAEAGEFPAADLEFFEKQVRPLLAKRCYTCHSARAKELKGGLRLDSRAAALVGGDTGPALVPGNIEESLLIDAINYGDLYQMPPKSKLPAEEIAILTKWVKLRAPWPRETPLVTAERAVFDLAARKRDHWCWQPLRPEPPPQVAETAWPQGPIDQFILAGLEARGLSPAPAADKRTLIRRVYFDLIGLPPSVDEVQAFVDDDSPRAFQTVVDRLLDSQHFGERWARHWMDLTRYAETHGHEFDYPIHHAARYRDYLIRAFNEDVPYDQFVREHLAGDLLEPPRRNPETGANESILGTGFWYLGEATHAPVDVMGDQAGRLDNQIDVMTKTFLGVTVACARCHDHKFDAITTADYYALTGFLKSSHRDILLLDPGEKIAARNSELDAISSQGDPVLARASAAVPATTFARYLLAAQDVIGRSAESPPQDNTAARVVFEDFEGDDYGDWEATGTAFGRGPQSAATTPAYQGDLGAHGKQWVNSHETRPGGDVGKGDGHVGTLTSPPFTIGHPVIEFLVGGGNHAGKTCLNLRIGDKVVRTQTGFNSNRMRPAQFDVREFQGQEARLEIVDQQTGGWGNIGVDYIVFSGAPEQDLAPLVAEVAAEVELDARQLAAWVKALRNEAIQTISHPLHAWSVLAADPTPDQFAAFRQLVAKRRQAAAQRDQDYPLLTDFASLDGWYRSGQAFNGQPTSRGQWDPRQETVRTRAGGMVDSGLRGDRQQGVLRSPTFTLTHKNIYHRLRGHGSKVRLIIDGYFMDTFNGLLFSGFAFDVKSPDGLTWHRQSQDMPRYLGHRGHLEFIDHGDGVVALDEIRLSNLDQPPPEILHSAAEVVTAEVNSLEQLAESYGRLWEESAEALGGATASAPDFDLLDWALAEGLVPLPAAGADQLRELGEQWRALAASVPAPDKALGIADGSAEVGRVYIRGNHRTLGPPAPRQSLEALVGRRPIEAPGSGRAELAEQLLAADNPLISRVIVNRLWHHVFGRGIVASVDNFGVLGSPPTHPELLDFLAQSFRDEGWSVKNMLRTMVLSRTYQMASTPTRQGTELDPSNLLLHRMRIRRLQGEAIRDAILSVSGRLDPAIYGNSVRVNITPFMQGRGRPGGSGPLDGNGRRSVYIEVRRNFLSPLMLAFDTPIPFNTVGRRNVSNVPAQALIMMNDPFVVAEAKRWAEKTLAATAEASDAQRIEGLYLAAFSRPPDADELAAAIDFLQDYRQQIGGASPDDVRVWANLCHVLMNVKEFVFVH